MPSKWNPDSGRTSGKSNPRRSTGRAQNWAAQRGSAMGQQQKMQGALGNAMPQRPMGPPPAMQSIAPPGGPMGPPPMGMGGGNPMQQLQTQRAAGVFDKPQMAPPMPQFQRPDMSAAMAQANQQRDAFRQGGVGLPPQGIGPPPGTAPGMPPPPGGGAFGGHNMPNVQGQLDMARQRMAAFQKPQMGSIQPPPWAGGGGPVADNQMGMQRRAAGLAGMQRPGMM